MKKCVIVLLVALGGCSAQRAYVQPYGQAIAVAEAKSSVAAEECRNRFAGRVQAVECSNPRIIEAYQSAGYRHMDLVYLMTAHRLAVAERQERGELTETQAALERAELQTRITTEEQRRDQVSATADAQSRAANAMLYAVLLQGLTVPAQPVTPVYYSAPAPSRSVTCTRLSANQVTCQ